ncbi:MAG TPA: hypothetical protein VH721_04310 [Gaiellaceae bacterium]
MKLRRLAPLLVAAALVAGCGGGASGNGVADKSADEIVADAGAAAKEATSVYVHGGTTSGSSPIEIDMHLVAGEGGAGHLVANGLSFDVVRIGDKAYFKGDDALWRQLGGEAAVALLHDRWLVAPATSGELASFAPLTDIEQLFDALLGDHGTLEKGDETEIDGNPAIAVEDTAEGGTLYVATTGEPYPLKVEGGSDSPGTISFDDWNEEYELTAPEGAIDIAQLQS